VHEVSGIDQTTINLSIKNDRSALTQAVADRLDMISSHGFPKYFGPQRFGFNQQNLVNAQRYFDNPRKKITRTKRGLYISAARSAIFNRVCAHRVQACSWNTPLHGEPMILDGAQSYFVNTGNDDDTIARCQAFDIHPSGPMWGSGSAIAQSECAQLETEAVSSLATLRQGLESIDLKQQRRALRVRPSNLTWHWLKPDCLELRFGLPVGSYATSLLTELVSIKQDDQSAQH